MNTFDKPGDLSPAFYIQKGRFYDKQSKTRRSLSGRSEFGGRIRTDRRKTGIDHSKQQGKQIQSYNDHCLSFLQDPLQSQDPDTLSIAGIKRAQISIHGFMRTDQSDRQRPFDQKDRQDQ